jgi:drug/metabolite transporter (DMT)-like permease
VTDAATTESPGSRRLAYLLLTLTAAFWAGNTITGRAVIEELPPLGFAVWRSFGAFLILAPIGLPRLWRARREIIAHWKILTVLGTLGTTGFAVFSFVALRSVEAVNATLIQGTQPIAVLLCAYVIFRRVITGRQIAGIVVALAGLVAIITRGDPAALAGFGLNPADFVFWLGVFCHALFTAMLPLRPASLDLIGFLTVTFLVGSITTLPLHLVEMVTVGAMPMTWTAAWAVGYVALFPSLLAQLFWVESIRRIGPAQAGYFIYLPVFGALMAIALLGEAFAWFHAAGIVLILSGVWLATAARGQTS